VLFGGAGLGSTRSDFSTDTYPPPATAAAEAATAATFPAADASKRAWALVTE